ncbi:MAG: DUF6036 family nucleotidyltransferase [Nanoarchaeota archaeon]
MINLNNQEALFNEVGRALPKKLIVYSIGGTAMMLRGLKGETLDIDLVFDKESDRKLFIKTLEKLKFRKDEKRVIETYGLKKNTPTMLRLASIDFIFDLFLNKIISSIFSEGMKKRATQTHEFGGNLVIKVADPSDILIMKSATGRAKDNEDIISIIDNNRLNWDVVLEEAKEQVKLGNEHAIMGLGENLEKLISRNIISVPKLFTDALWKLFKEQVKKKSKKSAE